MYAIINDSGTQITVREGDVVRVDLRDSKAGETVEFSSVAFVSKDGEVLSTEKELSNAKVVGKVLGEIKADKLIWSLFKRKRHSRNVRKGHRQKYIEVKIESIVA